MRERRLLVAATFCGFLGASAAILLLEHRHGAVAADPDRSQVEKNLKATLSDLKDASAAFRQVAKLVRPSVVHLTRERVVSEEPDPLVDMFERYFNDREVPRRSMKERAQGTGFIVRADGTCLTNNHVAGGGGKLVAKLADGREVAATVVGADTATDVAVIKLEGDGYTPVTLGDSDAVEVGDWALAFGNPFGLDQTVTAGIISAKSRSRVGIADYEDFIQTDAAINPGNSGGPLVDIRGQVIGINTAIASRSGGYQGVGFTIPINMAKTIMEGILASGHVVRGWLGVELDRSAVSGDRPSRPGALVKGVIAGGPAAVAGVRAGDVITAFDGKAVDDGTRLRLLAAACTVGRVVPLRVVRDGKEVDLSVTIAEKPVPSVGITAKELSPELVRRFGLPEGVLGVVITDVAPGSLAAQAGIQAGQVLRAIDDHAIASMADLDAAVARIDLRVGVKITVSDGATDASVVLRAR
ncbi:trypsin-like peptidase domain-containing protein [bacterium]|nr:trypsin-like peptidase domain-containing protein [bacterium]